MCVLSKSIFEMQNTYTGEAVPAEVKWPQRKIELRYAAVDPIMEMLCELWDLKVRCMSNTSAFYSCVCVCVCLCVPFSLFCLPALLGVREISGATVWEIQ